MFAAPTSGFGLPKDCEASRCHGRYQCRCPWLLRARVVRQGIGCRGGAQRMHAATVHVATGAVSLLRRVFSAPLSASFLFLGRYQDHQTGCRFADLLGGPTEDNIQQASFTMTA